MKTSKLIESQNATQDLVGRLEFDVKIGNEKMIEIPDKKRERVGYRDEREIDHGRHGFEVSVKSEDRKSERVANKPENDDDQRHVGEYRVEQVELVCVSIRIVSHALCQVFSQAG